MRVRNDKNGFLQLMKRAGIGTVFGMASAVIVLLALAALTASGAVSLKLAERLTPAAVVAGAAVAGVFTASKKEGGVVTAGLTAGVVFLAVLTIVMLLTPESEEKGQSYGRLVIAALAGGAFGGVLKIGKKRKKSKLRR